MGTHLLIRESTCIPDMGSLKVPREIYFSFCGPLVMVSGNMASPTMCAYSQLISYSKVSYPILGKVRDSVLPLIITHRVGTRTQLYDFMDGYKSIFVK